MLSLWKGILTRVLRSKLGHNATGGPRETEDVEGPRACKPIEDTAAGPSGVGKEALTQTRNVTGPHENTVPSPAPSRPAAPSYAELIATLTVKDENRLIEGLEDLGERGAAARAAGPAVLGLLHAAAGGELQLAAAICCARIRVVTEKVIEVLSHAVEDAWQRDDAVQAARAASAIADVGRRARIAIPGLVQALEIRDEFCKAHVAGALLFVARENRAVNELCSLSTSKDEHVRLSSVYFLRRAAGKSKAAVRALCTALRDPAAGVRDAAAGALQKVARRATFAIPMLAEALQDTEPSVRRYACRAIARFGEEARACAGVLRARLDDPDWRVRVAAAVSLYAVEPRSVLQIGNLLFQARAHPDYRVYLEGSRALKLIAECELRRAGWYTGSTIKPDRHVRADKTLPPAHVQEKDKSPTGPDVGPPAQKELWGMVWGFLERTEASLDLPSLPQATEQPDFTTWLRIVAERFARIEAALAHQSRIAISLTAERQALCELLQQSRACADKLDAAADKLHHAVVAHAAERPSEKEEPMRGGLTPKQLEVFQAIDKVPGADENARATIQQLLDRLDGDTITKNLTENLKHVLKQRGWGIQCPTCHKAAAPLWKGTQIQFTHSEKKARGQRSQSVTHAGRSVFHDLRVVPRPDNRVRKSL